MYKDIVPRFGVRHSDKLEQTAYFVVANISNLTSYNKIANLVGVHENTVKEYLSFFEKAYLFFTTNRFAYSLKNR